MIVLASSLATDITNNSLSWSFIIRFETRSGYVFGYTTYDEPITHDGVVYSPGLSQTELTKGWDGFVSNVDLELLLETDISKGFLRNLIVSGYYDGTRYRMSIINHETPEGILSVQSGVVGEFSVRDRRLVNVELRSLTQVLKEQSVVSLFTPSDPELLGSEKNGVNLSAFTVSATVYQVDNERNSIRFIDSSGDTGTNWAETNYYAYGVVKWTSGDNYIPSQNNTHYFQNEIRTNVSGNRFILQNSTAFPVKVGDTALLIAGYDGSIEQAKTKFNNVVNFRGFPLIPGNNKLLEQGEIVE